MKYIPVIGLEIHAELKTNSKMFCGCSNDPEIKEPNTTICPVCMGHPGTLPVINMKAVESVIKAGLALHCEVADTTHFDRKNYFYPDLPKGYQISQQDIPMVSNGHLEINGRKIRINRIHLEEDTGKSVHSKGTDYSLIDFNRAGRPLMELVTEPDIVSGEEARCFCEELRLILRYLDISGANMEKGEMRCEVNISLAVKKGEFGTKVEIKNLNSFRAVEQSVNHEIERQSKLLDAGEKVVQETRGWNENKRETFAQRAKEEAGDYRYFPEPDLPPLTQLAAVAKRLNSELPELPQAMRKRFAGEYSLPESDINTLALNRGLAIYFEQVVSELKTWLKIKSIEDKQPLIKLTANYILTELQKLILVAKSQIEDCKISPENFAEFIALIANKEISSSAAQAVLKEMFKTGADPSHVIEDKQLKQVSDEGAIAGMVDKVITENPQSVKDFQNGKEKALQFLVGKVMAASKGQANPQIARQLLEQKLK